jgi:RNA polymerase sigma factor (sigma-70 family)
MNELIQLWNPWLHRLIRQWLRTDIEEVAQTTWIEAWVSLGKLQEPRAFEAWLRQIAFRCASHHIRSLARSEQLVAAAEMFYEPHLAWLGSVLGRLAPAQGSVMRMHFAEGYTVQEIAAILLIPEGTVKSRIRLAKSVLRRQLREGEEK